MYSVNSVFHHFEKSIPVHLQHIFEEGGTGFHCTYAFISCTQAQAEHLHGMNCTHPGTAMSSLLEYNYSRRA